MAASAKHHLGQRKSPRIEFDRKGFLISAPDAPWLECLVIDVSDGGVCLNVGAVAVPELFGLAFNSAGSILRVCSLAWRSGELVGGRFVSARQLRSQQSAQKTKVNT